MKIEEFYVLQVYSQEASRRIIGTFKKDET